MIYTVAIYNEFGVRVSVLRDVKSPTYSRSRNSADQISFGLPRTSVGVNEIKTGRRFEILRTLNGVSEVEESGFVSNYSYSGDDFVVEGFTEEVLLSRFRTPAQYGYVLSSENQTLDDLVAQFDRSFLIERVKFNWSDYLLTSSNIDFITDPSFFLLSSSGSPGNPVYSSSGSATFRFEKTADEEWDRFRWVSDFFKDEVGQLSSFLSYRTFDNVGSPGSFTTPQAGASTDIVGIVIAAQSANQYLDVKVDLATDTNQSSPVFFSLEVIKRGPTPIHTVSVNVAAANIATPGLDAEGSTFLDLLIAACEPSGYEFRVFDGELIVEPTFGEDRTIDYSVVAA